MGIHGIAGKMMVNHREVKSNTIRLTGGTKAALETWMKARGDAPGYLLLDDDNADSEFFGRPALRRVVTRRWRQAGLRALTLEDLYRTWVRERFTAACRDLWGDPAAGWRDSVWMPPIQDSDGGFPAP